MQPQQQQNIEYIEKQALLDYFNKVSSYNATFSYTYFSRTTQDFFFKFSDSKRIHFRDVPFIFEYERNAIKDVIKRHHPTGDCENQSGHYLSPGMFNLFLHWATGFPFDSIFLTLRFSKKSMTHNGIVLYNYLDLVSRAGSGAFGSFVRFVVTCLYDYLDKKGTLFYAELINKLVI